MQEPETYIATLINETLSRRKAMRIDGTPLPAASLYALRARLSLCGLAAKRRRNLPELEATRRRALGDLMRASYHESRGHAPPELVQITWAAVGLLGLEQPREVGTA